MKMNNLLGDIQFGFRPGRSPEDVLNVIPHRTSQTPDNKFITRTIASDILYEKVRHWGLLRKFSSGGISGSTLSVIKPFMKVVIKGQISEDIKINTAVPHGFIINTNFFLYINDLPKGIPRLIVSNFGDDNTLKGQLQRSRCPEPIRSFFC